MDIVKQNKLNNIKAEKRVRERELNREIEEKKYKNAYSDGYIQGYKDTLERDPCKWIDVEDKLPETLQSVLCALENGAVLQLTYGDLSGFFMPLSSQKVLPSNPVTHWMPLPEPPKD